MQQLMALPTAHRQRPHDQVGAGDTNFNAVLDHEIKELVDTEHHHHNPRPFNVQLLSYLHRLRLRDAKGLNFTQAFAAILVDNAKASKCTFLTFTSTIASCFKTTVTPNTTSLLRLIFRSFETQWQGHRCGYMDVCTCWWCCG